MPDSVAKIQITAEDLASPTLSGVAESLRGVGAAATETSTALSTTVSPLRDVEVASGTVTAAQREATLAALGLSEAVTTEATAVEAASVGMAGFGVAAEGLLATLTPLGVVAAAAGVAMGAWELVKWTAEWSGLTQAVEDGYHALVTGVADSAGAAANAKLTIEGMANVHDTLALASQHAGREVTDLTEAIQINTQYVQDNTDRIGRSHAWEDNGKQIAAWRSELDTVRDQGVLPYLAMDIESHNFKLNELSSRYHASSGAIQLFEQDLKDDAAAQKIAAAATRDHTDALASYFDLLASNVGRSETNGPGSALGQSGFAFRQTGVGFGAGLSPATTRGQDFTGGFPQATLGLGPDPSFTRGIDQGTIDEIGGIRGNQMPGSSSIGLQPSRLSGLLDEATQKTAGWHKEISDTSRALSELANVSGSSFGGIVKDLSEVLAATNTVAKGIDLFTKGDKMGGVATMAAGALSAAENISASAKGQSVGVGALGGAASGAEVGMAAGPLGAAVGAVAGALVGAISSVTGPSKAELQTRQDRADAGLDATSIQADEDAMMHFGATADQARTQVAAALDAKTPAAFAAAMAPVRAALQHDTDVSTAVTSVQSLVKAYTDAGHVMPQSLRDTITTVSQLKGVTADEQTALKSMADSANPDFESLKQKAADLGLNLQQLGTKFEAGDVNERAATLAQTMDDLKAAGGDVGGMLQGTMTKFGDLAQEAITSGAQLPASIKDYMKNLFDTGQLVDTAGDKITDFSKLSFDDAPVKTGIDGINTSIDHLSAVLDQLPAKFGVAGSAADTAFNGVHPGGAPGASTGGYVTNSGIVHFSTGGYAGVDSVRAMLAPGEYVLTPHQVANLARGGGGGLTGADVHAAVKSAFRGLEDRIDRHFSTLPILLKHALRGR